MSETTLIWLFAGSYGLGAFAVLLIGKHVLSCNKQQNENSITLARLDEKLSAVISEIGTHETGMIGQLHRYSKEIRDLTIEVRHLKEDRE